MNIGEAAAASGVSAKMIRHYESIGLIPPPPRSAAGYRRYGHHDVARLAFVRRARAAGFDTADIGRLLRLWQDSRRPAREVRRIAEAHLLEIRTRMEELAGVAAALSHLVDHCRGDERPECPILEGLVRMDPPERPRSGKMPVPGRRKPPPEPPGAPAGRVPRRG